MNSIAEAHCNNRRNAADNRTPRRVSRARDAFARERDRVAGAAKGVLRDQRRGAPGIGVETDGDATTRGRQLETEFERDVGGNGGTGARRRARDVSGKLSEIAGSIVAVDGLRTRA